MVMNEQTTVKILTNSGFKYLGKFVSKDDTFVEINDFRQGTIKIPLLNISFMQEVSQ